MKSYALVIERTVRLLTTIWLDGTNTDNVKAQFHAAVKAEDLSELEDEDWGLNRAPYIGKFEVLEVNED